MKDGISEKVRELTAELSESYPLLLSKYPLDLYDKEIKSYTEFRSALFFSPKLVKIFDGIKEQYNWHVAALYHKLALSVFIMNTQEKLDSQYLPERIVALYHNWFERVYRDFSVQPDSYYHHEKSPFRQDLAVCRQKAIPVGGAWIIELSSMRTKYLSTDHWPNGEKNAITTFTKKPLKKKLRIIERVWTLLARLRLDNSIVPILMLIFERLSVYSSYYIIHTVSRYLPRFTKEQMNQAYLNISELLKIHSNVRGIFRESWFLDPNLKDISPELSYLWEVPQQNGAKLFRTGTSGTTAQKAICMSPLRKRLYEKGEYKPMRYAYVWPREKLIRWASLASRNI